MIASKNTLKLIAKLKMAKFRDANAQFLVEGDKLVLEAITSIPQNIISIFVCSNTKIPQEILNNFDVYIVSDAELIKLSTQISPQYSIALISNSIHYPPKLNSKLILACDGIQDPGNFGTIIRTADWFGINSIIASKNTVDVYNQKVIQASMGSIFRVKVEYVDLPVWLKNSGKRIIGTLLNGKSIYEVNLIEPSVFIIGNEGKGLSEEVLSLIDEAITIPRIGSAESLNAAVANGIILAEFSKKIGYA